MGEERLKELEKKLEQAKTDSNIPPPSEMISEFPLTDVCYPLACVSMLTDSHRV